MPIFSPSNEKLVVTQNDILRRMSSLPKNKTGNFWNNSTFSLGH
jgi:hypothetical protein